MIMDAILATIVDGGRAIILKFREAVQIFFFSFSLLILIKPIDDGFVQPLPRRLPGVGLLVGMFVCLCLTSKKPSEREFFVPAGTD
jgi:hypothetical protein